VFPVDLAGFQASWIGSLQGERDLFRHVTCYRKALARGITSAWHAIIRKGA